MLKEQKFPQTEDTPAHSVERNSRGEELMVSRSAAQMLKGLLQMVLGFTVQQPHQKCHMSFVVCENRRKYKWK